MNHLNSELDIDERAPVESLQDNSYLINHPTHPGSKKPDAPQ